MERSPEQPESYVLRGGQAGAARLHLINRVKWPTTERLLRAAGLHPLIGTHGDSYLGKTGASSMVRSPTRSVRMLQDTSCTIRTDTCS